MTPKTIYKSLMRSSGRNIPKNFYLPFFHSKRFPNEFNSNNNLNPKTPGVGGNQFDPPCGFSKNVSSKERAKSWFFVTFNIILKHIFPENFIEFSQVVQKI